MNKTKSLSVPRNPLTRLQELEAGLEARKGQPPAPEPTRTNEPTNARTHASTHEPTNGGADLERTTLLQLLKTPLPAEHAKGPFQAGTVRMPVEVWKRVGWVSALTGRTKQDIIGEALRAYLERLPKEG